MVSGQARMLGVRDLVMFHRWASVAKMKVEHNMTPPANMTIKAFNLTYGVEVRTWVQVHKILADAKADIAAERKAQHAGGSK